MPEATPPVSTPAVASKPAAASVAVNALDRLARVLRLGWHGVKLACFGALLAVLFSASLLALCIEGLTTYLGSYIGPDLYADLEHKLTPKYAVRIESDEGHLLGSFGADDARREPLHELPSTFADLLVAFEDSRFYAHNGVDRVRLFGAFANTIRGQLEGGSTLTMQLAKMLKGDGARTLRRKLDDLALALELERHLSKTEVLRLYADHAFFGNNVYGLANACRYYFAKPQCHGLQLDEAAFLVGLVKAPSKYAGDRELGLSRRDMVLTVALGAELPPTSDKPETWLAWLAQGGLSELGARHLLKRHGLAGHYDRATIAAALNRPLAFSHLREEQPSPYVRDFAQRIGEERLGHEQMGRGATLKLTVSSRAQAVSEQALEEAIATAAADGVADAELLDGGIVVLDAASGEVLSLVGGRDYGRSQVPFALRPIQVGSAMKPFVYAAGFDAGVITPGAKVTDTRICIDGWCPKNYANKYYGALPVEDALARSLNSVAVRTAQKLSVPELSLTLRELGFTAPLEQNLTLALGSAEVSLLELSGAYTALLDGRVKRPRLLRQALARDLRARLLASDEPRAPRRVFSLEAAAAVRAGLLRALRPGGTSVRLGAELERAFALARVEAPPEVACKTGTTNESHRVGMVCLVSDSDLGRPLVVATFLGHHVPRPLGEKATGGKLATPAMARIITSLARDRSQYLRFVSRGSVGATCQPPAQAEGEALTATSEHGLAVSMVRAGGRGWLRQLYAQGVGLTGLQALAAVLPVTVTSEERFTERMRDEEWRQGGGFARALSLVRRLGAFVSMRGLDGEEPRDLVRIRDTEDGFAVIEQQPDRVLTTMARAAEEPQEIAVHVRRDAHGVEEVVGVDVMGAQGPQSFVRVGRQLRRARAVRVVVERGAFASAWATAGLDARQFLELQKMVAGRGVDFDRVLRGFEVSVLLNGRSVAAARLRVPREDGTTRGFAVARSTSGIFDADGRSISAWPIVASDAEIFREAKTRAPIAAWMRSREGAPVLAPTRARVTAVDAEAGRVWLRAANGRTLSVAGVLPTVALNDVVAAGELLGRVDSRQSVMVRAASGIDSIVTLTNNDVSAIARSEVASALAHLDNALRSPARETPALFAQGGPDAESGTFGLR